ncbi:MAG: hypothetical protein SFZ24_08400 [Planctomycetota bacterium]|nr:hypothetical protein [Planctomycetota bacterium]
MKHPWQCSGGTERSDERETGRARLPGGAARALERASACVPRVAEWNSPFEAEQEARRLYVSTLPGWAMDVLNLRRGKGRAAKAGGVPVGLRRAA